MPPCRRGSHCIPPSLPKRFARRVAAPSRAFGGRALHRPPAFAARRYASARIRWAPPASRRAQATQATCGSQRAFTPLLDRRPYTTRVRLAGVHITRPNSSARRAAEAIAPPGRDFTESPFRRPRRMPSHAASLSPGWRSTPWPFFGFTRVASVHACGFAPR